MHLLYDKGANQDFRYTLLNTETTSAILLHTCKQGNHIFKEVTEVAGNHLGKLTDIYDIQREFSKFFLSKLNVNKITCALPYRHSVSLDVKNFSFSLCINEDGSQKESIHFNNEEYYKAELTWLSV